MIAAERFQLKTVEDEGCGSSARRVLDGRRLSIRRNASVSFRHRPAQALWRKAHGLKVATMADQFTLEVTLKVAANDPVEVTSIVSFDAGEVDVSFCSKV